MSARPFLVDGRRIILDGRQGWALARLVAAGAAGLTPITEPAPRWSSYIHKLRRLGIAIETIDESHAGEFAGRHARYRLFSQVEILTQEAA